MYPNNTPWPSATPVAERHAPERQAPRMLDTVKVDTAETFQSVMFMSSQARREFTQDRRPAEQKPQKTTQDGVPLWSVQVVAVTWRGKSELFAVTVPLHSDPAEKFQTGHPVHLDGLTFGVSAKRDGGGYVTWCSADAIEPAGAMAKAQAS